MLSCAKGDPAVLLWDLRKLGTLPPTSIQSETSTRYNK